MLPPSLDRKTRADQRRGIRRRVGELPEEAQAGETAYHGRRARKIASGSHFEYWLNQPLYLLAGFVGASRRPLLLLAEGRSYYLTSSIVWRASARRTEGK